MWGATCTTKISADLSDFQVRESSLLQSLQIHEVPCER